MVGGEGVTGKGEGEGENGGGRVGGGDGEIQTSVVTASTPSPAPRPPAPPLPPPPLPNHHCTRRRGRGRGGTTASVGGCPSPPPPPPPRPFSATPAGFAPQASQCPQRPGSEPGYQSQAEEIRLAIFWFRMCSVIGITEKKNSFRRWYYISMVTVIINDGITIWI